MKVEISNRTKILFVGLLLLTLLVAYVIQLFFISFEDLKVVTVVSYLVNFAICLASFFALARLSKKDSSNLGAVFLAFSMLKFGVYFLGFRFYFQADDIVTKQEYAVFFVPYLLSILIEVIFLIIQLNSAEMDPTKFIIHVDEEEETEGANIDDLDRSN